MAFGRIFDRRRDSFSIGKLVAATAEHPEFFSKKMLRLRKRGAVPAVETDPEWLADYLASAWEPLAADLTPLIPALAEQEARFTKIYQPIRHKIFAHRSKEDDDAIWTLFNNTNIPEVNRILGFLFTVTTGIWQMAWNGKQLMLNDTDRYERFVENLTDEVTRFVQQLP